MTRVGSAPQRPSARLRQQLLPGLGSCLEIPVDVLDQNNRGIDNNAEINGADRKKVGVLAAQDQDDDAEEQSERNIRADDNGAAQIAKEDPLDEEDQHTAEDEIMQDGSGGDGDQLAAIVVGHELDAGRQRAVGIDFLNLGVNAIDHILGVQRAVHDHDRSDDIVFVVLLLQLCTKTTVIGDLLTTGTPLVHDVFFDIFYLNPA